MNAAKLESLLGHAEAITAALRAEIELARSNTDPLAVHIYRSRRDHKATMRTDHSKSGHHVEREMMQSFQGARELGFRGGMDAWRDLMAS